MKKQFQDCFLGWVAGVEHREPPVIAGSVGSLRSTTATRKGL